VQNIGIAKRMRAVLPWRRVLEKLVLSSERMSHKDHDRKGSVEKKIFWS
jgi:hypothetical protein